MSGAGSRKNSPAIPRPQATASAKTGFESEALLRVAGCIFCGEIFAFLIAGPFYYLLRGDLNAYLIVPLIVFVLAWSWLLWRVTNGFVLWLALIAAHLATVFLCIAHRTHTIFALTVLSTLIPPALAYAACRIFRWPKGLFFAVFSVCLWADLWLFARSSDFLYAQQPSPAAWGVDTTVHEPIWPETRRISPPQWDATGDNQALRYVELLQRQPYIFSTKMRSSLSGRSFDADLAARRWSGMVARYSFLLPPTQFVQARKKLFSSRKLVVRMKGPSSEDAFAADLAARRWSSMVMPRRYFELIHSDLPAPAQEKFFAVGEPLFQLKSGVLRIADGALPAFFKAMPVKDVRCVLDCFAVSSEPTDAALSRWSVPVEKAVSLANACRPSAFSYTTSGSFAELDLDYTSERDGILFWSDSYDERWAASLDGNPASLSRANMNFKALAIPAGTHRLHFSFDPSDFRISLLLYYGAFILCLALAAALSLRRKAPTEAEPQHLNFS